MQALRQRAADAGKEAGGVVAVDVVEDVGWEREALKQWRGHVVEVGGIDHHEVGVGNGALA